MRRFQVANHSCLMVKYSKDDRYDRDAVATHDRSVGMSYYKWSPPKAVPPRLSTAE